MVNNHKFKYKFYKFNFLIGVKNMKFNFVDFCLMYKLTFR